MPLPLPHLDDRDFDQLIDEARSMIPVHAPEWTDHNASDPGVTLLELFAYLTEMGLYRLDRVSAADRRTFLRLLGADVGVARAASAVLVFERTTPGGALSLPAGLQVGSADDGVVFQTLASLDVVDARVVSLLAIRAGQSVDLTGMSASMGVAFRPFGDRPALDDALYVGFDRPPGAAGALMRLYVFGEAADRDAEAWHALAAEAREVRRARRDACAGRRAGHVGRFWRHYGAQLAWEYFDAAGAWKRLAHVRDRTRALTISGSVHVRLPGPAMHAAGGVPGHAGTFFVRARLRAGAYDCAPVIRGVRVNAVAARHAADVPAAEAFGPSAGHAHQAYRLTGRPVVPGSSRVRATAAGASPDVWTEVAEWDRSGPFDRHYRIDPASGEVAFGDGRRGRVPAAGATFSATYRVGGGPEGNVPAGTLNRVRRQGRNAGLPQWSVIAASVGVAQPVAAYGGTAAMTLAEAEGLAVRRLAVARAAVTLRDLERLATSVPGAPVARAYAIAQSHPAASCLTAAGCVTVVIVPSCADANPRPGEALCGLVAAALDRRRPVAMEVHVVGPRYTTVTVRARLHAAVTGGRTATAGAARAALIEFFHPLRGGPDATGWPAGRSVYRSEVLALLSALPGVAHVSDLLLERDGDIAGRCGNIEMCADGLVESGPHQIDVG